MAAVLDLMPKINSPSGATTTSIAESYQHDLIDLSTYTLPTTTSGVATGGYILALKHRLKHELLLPKARLDVQLYTPTFVHDSLMLPGSLAQAVGKNSEWDIIDRMTPAILPYHRALIHPITKAPFLVTSTDSNDYAQGMLILGQGKSQRSLINEHYKADGNTKAKAEVIVETMSPVPRAARVDNKRWAHEKIKVQADIWVRPGCDAEDFTQVELVPWQLEKFLTGVYHGWLEM